MTFAQQELLEEVLQEKDESLRSRLIAELSQFGGPGAELLLILRKQQYTSPLDETSS